jgi:hypothetical protein
MGLIEILKTPIRLPGSLRATPPAHGLAPAIPPTTSTWDPPISRRLQAEAKAHLISELALAIRNGVDLAVATDAIGRDESHRRTASPPAFLYWKSVHPSAIGNWAATNQTILAIRLGLVVLTVTLIQALIGWLNPSASYGLTLAYFSLGVLACFLMPREVVGPLVLIVIYLPVFAYRFFLFILCVLLPQYAIFLLAIASGRIFRPEPTMRRIAQRMNSLLAAGHSLADVVDALPLDFTPTEAALIRTAIEAGTLPETLEGMAARLTRSTNQPRYSVLGYFLFYGTMMLLVGSFLQYYIAPKYADIYAQLGAELPLITQILISIALGFTGGFGPAPILLTAGFASVFAYRIARTGNYWTAVTAWIALAFLGITLTLHFGNPEHIFPTLTFAGAYTLRIILNPYGQATDFQINLFHLFGVFAALLAYPLLVMVANHRKSRRPRSAGQEHPKSAIFVDPFVFLITMALMVLLGIGTALLYNQFIAGAVQSTPFQRVLPWLLPSIPIILYFSFLKSPLEKYAEYRKNRVAHISIRRILVAAFRKLPGVPYLFGRHDLQLEILRIVEAGVSGRLPDAAIIRCLAISPPTGFRRNMEAAVQSVESGKPVLRALCDSGTLTDRIAARVGGIVPDSGLAGHLRGAIEDFECQAEIHRRRQEDRLKILGYLFMGGCTLAILLGSYAALFSLPRIVGR